MGLTRGCISRNQSNALTGSGTLGPRLDYEVLIRACKAREPVKYLSSKKRKPFEFLTDMNVDTNIILWKINFNKEYKNMNKLNPEYKRMGKCNILFKEIMSN